MERKVVVFGLLLGCCFGCATMFSGASYQFSMISSSLESVS
jgi:hypothetical protein